MHPSVQTFFKEFRTDAVGSTFTLVQVNGGGNDQTDPGVEVCRNYVHQVLYQLTRCRLRQIWTSNTPLVSLFQRQILTTGNFGVWCYKPVCQTYLTFSSAQEDPPLSSLIPILPPTPTNLTSTGLLSF